jgi:adenine-specific DNA-methyltransferase
MSAHAQNHVAVLARCEWGHDDYSLNVANLPMAKPAAPEPEPRPADTEKTARGEARTPDLFSDASEGDAP